jgi:hypothetical protein
MLSAVGIVLVGVVGLTGAVGAFVVAAAVGALISGPTFPPPEVGTKLQCRPRLKLIRRK